MTVQSACTRVLLTALLSGGPWLAPHISYAKHDCDQRLNMPVVPCRGIVPSAVTTQGSGASHRPSFVHRDALRHSETTSSVAPLTATDARRNFAVVEAGRGGPETLSIRDATSTASPVHAAAEQTVSGTLAFTQWSVTRAGDRRENLLTVSSGARWVATSSAAWLTVTPASGTGSGNLTLTVSASTELAPRTAAVTVANQLITVTQAGLSTVSPTKLDIPATDAYRVIELSVPGTGVPWTAASGASWLTVAPRSGVGTGNVSIWALPNDRSVHPRTGVVTIAGHQLTVTQAGSTATFLLSPTNWLPLSTGGTRALQVFTTANDAPWTASSSAPWLLTSPASGVGPSDVTLISTPNYDGVSRTATVTIGNQQVTVTQGASNRPFGLTVHSVVGNTVTLHWQWPGASPDGYVLRGGYTEGQSVGSLLTPRTVPSLTFEAPSGVFYVRVAGVRSGELPASADVRLAVNVPEPPSAPVELLGDANDKGLTLSWRNTWAGGTPEGLVLDVTGALTASIPLGQTDRFSFPDAPAGEYSFRVRAVNALGSSPPSNTVRLSFPGACRPPGIPSGMQSYREGNVVTVRWNAPTSGAAVGDYVLTVSGSAQLTLPISGREISSPVPRGTYRFTVAARNSCGMGPVFPAQSVTVP